MPSQGKIISAVNAVLRKQKTIDFELNKTGVCAGLATLYIKYTLEGRKEAFFVQLGRLKNLSEKDLAYDGELNKFITEIEKSFRPNCYSNDHIRQTDVEKIIDINGEEPRNEFNIGRIAKHREWTYLLKEITRDNRTYYIVSHNHAIAIDYSNGKYHFYDPNFDEELHYSNPIAVIKKLQQSFTYNNQVQGLGIKVYAHPSSAPVSYPDHDLLYQKVPIEMQKEIFKDKSYQHLTFAVDVRDLSTVDRLVREKKIDWAHVSSEFVLPQMNDFLLAEPASEENKKALAQSIWINFAQGNIEQLQRLIEAYQRFYPDVKSTNNLKNVLQESLKGLLAADHFRVMHLVQNHTFLKELAARLSLGNKQTLPALNHLRLLDFLSQDAIDSKMYAFLDTLSIDALTQQITLAALNQKAVLQVLISYCEARKKLPKKASFTEDLLKNIDGLTFNKLRKLGYTVDVSKLALLSLCASRNDKSILEQYIHAYLEDAHRKDIIENIQKNDKSLNLSETVGSVSLLDCVVLLQNDQVIKSAWSDAVSAESIEASLYSSLMMGNKKISLFLHKKLHEKNKKADEAYLQELFKKALEDGLLNSLELFIHLGLKIDDKNQLIELLNVCYRADDFGLIEQLLKKADKELQQMIVSVSIEYDLPEVISLCKQYTPNVFNDLFQSLMKQDKWSNSLSQLKAINNIMLTLPEELFDRSFDINMQKPFHLFCYQKNTFNLLKLAKPVEFTEDELFDLYQSLSQAKNQQGIIHLLTVYPQLIANDALIADLIAKGYTDALLKVVDEVVFSDAQLDTILSAAISQNNEKLLSALVQQQKLTASTVLAKPMQQLFEEAIQARQAIPFQAFARCSADFALDFKALFLLSCQHQRLALANALLEEDLGLNNEEIALAIRQAFGEKTANEIYDTVYQQAYGRWYRLLATVSLSSPQSQLMQSIRAPEQDKGLQRKEPLFKRAIREKNAELYEKLFAEDNLALSKDCLNLLEDPFLPLFVIHSLKDKYTLNSLLDCALQHENWLVIAHLLAHNEGNELEEGLMETIRSHRDDIVEAYLAKLCKSSHLGDSRPHLFALLGESRAEDAYLKQWSLPYHEQIVEALTQIEQRMLADKQPLNGQIYRFNSTNAPFTEALNEISTLCDMLAQRVNEKGILLAESIEDDELVHGFASIKQIMADHDVSAYYLSDEQVDFLEKLSNNPRFSAICQQEQRIYSLLKDYGVETSAELPERAQEAFLTEKDLLSRSLEQANLSMEFAIRQIQGTKKPAKNNAHKLDKIDAILTSLRHKIGEEKQHSFSKALQGAHCLLASLETARGSYERNLCDMSTQEAGNVFLTECKKAIDEAKPVLERDLDWGSYLANLFKSFANAIIGIFTSNPHAFYSLKRASSVLNVETAEQALITELGSPTLH